MDILLSEMLSSFEPRRLFCYVLKQMLDLLNESLSGFAHLDPSADRYMAIPQRTNATAAMMP